MRVATIFDIEGELRFRDRETSVIADLARLDNIVLATGGGAVIRPQNRACLSAHGTVIYLRATIDDLLARTLHDKTAHCCRSPIHAPNWKACSRSATRSTAKWPTSSSTPRNRMSACWLRA